MRHIRPCESNRHKPKKDFPRTLCRKALSSVTFGYFRPHLRTWITTVSTVSSLTTKDNSDKSQSPLNLKIALLTTVNARFFIVNRASQVIYACNELFQITPPLLAAFLRHVIMKLRLLSAETCPTLPKRPLELAFPNINSGPLTLLTLLHFSLSL